MSFIHKHPYPPFVFKGMERLLVGTLPPPRFSTGALRPGDVNFCYGSRDGLLWPVLDRIYNLDLSYETTAAAITQRQAFLKSRRIGICDIVEQAERRRIDASDLGMRKLVLRDLLGILREYSSVHTLLFTGGNSKNGPEYLFRRLLKPKGLALKLQQERTPRIHTFDLPVTGGRMRELQTVSLTAPSGSANRAIGSMHAYKARKAADPDYTVMDFRVEQYRQFF